MIIQFPNVIFRWHNAKKGICGVEDYITDFYKGIYGYDLKTGQTVYIISYCGEGDYSKFYIYHAVIEQVNKTGVLITDWMEKGWEENDPVEKFNFYEQNSKGWLPWKIGDCDLCIEPCPSLYENYKAKDLVKGTAREEVVKIINGKSINDGRGIGMFYQHGGWRTKARHYADNIKNIVKLGQMELELEQ